MEAIAKSKAVLTQTDKIIESIGWSTLLILWEITIWSYTILPDKIPIHYNNLSCAGNNRINKRFATKGKLQPLYLSKHQKP